MNTRTLVAIALIFAVGFEWVASSQTTNSPVLGWASIGEMSVPARSGNALLFRNQQGALSVTALSDDVIRVRFTRGQSFGRDYSYAVVTRDLGSPSVLVSSIENGTVLATTSLRVTVQHNPLRISFANAAGESLDADSPELGIAFSGSRFRVAKRLRDDEHVYGLGEKNGRLDKRGWALGGYSYAMWNSDTYAYDGSTDPLYVSVPFFMVVRAGQAHGIFLDNTWRSFFDIGHEQYGALTFGADGGDLDYYFINGPKPAHVVERYTALTGRTPLPPLWALGYNQCRYSYFPESRVRLVADTFREKKVPADVIWLDIHYQDSYKPFTWDHERFPNPKQMLSDLRQQGFRVVSIVDPHPKKEKGYAPYDSGIAGGHFAKLPDGSVYEGPVWPGQATNNPGPSVFPDFTRPETRRWWGDLYKDLLEQGIAGIWNDMNEPSVFVAPMVTMPLDIQFDNEGHPTTAREVHNVYGQQMTRATFEGLNRLRPKERPFILTRASFAGGQRYAAAWPGDNTADWSSLRQSIPTLLGLGLSGFSFVGSDIGGFVRPASPELYTRWLQAGVFYPFMRSHSELGAPEKEPWAFGYQNEGVNRRAIELRYELLPYIYNTMQEASETGIPAMRPLFLEFPQDETVAAIDDQFMFGSDLMVAPVVFEGATERVIYFPEGDWYDYWTGKHFIGGTRKIIPVSLESIPLFVRGGGFIFRQPIVQHTGEMPGQRLRVLIAPAKGSNGTLYEDDGLSVDYRKEGFMKRRFQQKREAQMLTVEVSAPSGSFRPMPRDIVFETSLDREPRSVEFQSGDGGNRAVSHVAPDALSTMSEGWSFADGVLTVKARDRWEFRRLLVTL